MERFDIPPEDCVIVRALSQTASLREAAALLRCDPASLVRKVQRISVEHELLRKIKGRWVPTEKGQRMARWVEEGVLSQKLLLDERTRLRIATTMWMAEQILIPNMEHLSVETNRRFVWSVRTPKQGFESDLLNGAADFVVACHAPHDPAIAHKKVAPENWVVVIPVEWERPIKKLPFAEALGVLSSKPFIRHAELNPESLLPLESTASVSDLVVDNLISVRSAVENGLGWSCVPEILVRSALRMRRLAAARIPVHFKADVCLWWLRASRGSPQNARALGKWLAESLHAGSLMLVKASSARE